MKNISIFWAVLLFSLAFSYSVKANVLVVTDANNGFLSAVNSAQAGDEIWFNIPGNGVHIINASTVTISQGISIKGFSQPGSSSGNWNIVFENTTFQICADGVSIDGIQFNNSNHAIIISTQNYIFWHQNIFITNCLFNGCTTGVTTTYSSIFYVKEMYVENNKFKLCNTGVAIDGGYSDQINTNVFDSCQTAIAFINHPASSCVIRNNSFTNCSEAAFNNITESHELRINNNYFDYCKRAVYFPIPTVYAGGDFCNIDSNTMGLYVDTVLVDYNPVDIFYFRHNLVNSKIGIYCYAGGAYIDSNKITTTAGSAITLNSTGLNAGKFIMVGDSFFVANGNNSPCITLQENGGDYYGEADINYNKFFGNNLSTGLFLSGLQINNVIGNQIKGFKDGVILLNTIRHTSGSVYFLFNADSNNIRNCVNGISCKSLDSALINNVHIVNNEISFCKSDAININSYLIWQLKINSNKLVNNGGAGIRIVYPADSIYDLYGSNLIWIDVGKNEIYNNNACGIIMPFVKGTNNVIVPLNPVPEIDSAAYRNNAYYVSGHFTSYVNPFSQFNLDYMCQVYVTDSSNSINGICKYYLGEKKLTWDLYHISNPGYFKDTIISPFLGNYISSMSKSPGFSYFSDYDSTFSMLSKTYKIGTGLLTQCSAAFSIFPDTNVPHNWFALNTSMGASPINYYWSWGDGTTSTGTNPSHTYSSPGYYHICLTTFDASGCTSIHCDSSTYYDRLDSNNSMVTINVVNSLPNEVKNFQSPNNSLTIFPNPCSVCFIKGIDNPSDLIITDLLGRKIEVSFNKSSGGYSIEMQQYAYGIYLVHDTKTGETKKFVKD